MLAMAMLTGACASTDEATDGEPSGTSNNTADNDSTEDASQIEARVDPAESAAQVIDALNAEADQLVGPSTEYVARQIIGESSEPANYVQLCTAEREIRKNTLAALPEQIDDIRLADQYLIYRAATETFVAVHADACDDITNRQVEMEVDMSLYGQVRDALFQAEQDMRAACQGALEGFAPYGVLNCDSESKVDPPIDLGQLDDSRVNDADPLAGPTGGLGQPWAEIPAGKAELSWFPRPFVIDHVDPLNLQTEEDYVFITEVPDGPTFGLYALDELADPNQLDLYEVISTIPISDELTAWFDAIPVAVTDRTETAVGGAPAVHWQFSPDRDASIAATGDVSVTLAASGVTEFASITVYADEPEMHHLWHITTPSGPVLVHVLDVGFGDFEFAELVLGSITFEAS